MPEGAGASWHERIDEQLSRGTASEEIGRCSDETFIRRASLDFRGVTPTADEVRAFVADESAEKRGRWVDAFIADPQHLRHLTNVLDVLLMERRAEKHVKPDEWRAWLRSQVAARTPWDVLVRRLLSVDGADESTRGAARWILDREAEPNALTRDVSRLFLGTDLSCAQCHDHPRIADYWQRDYQGLLAFFSRTYLFQPDPMKPALVGERADGEVSFASVFTAISGEAPPCLPGEPCLTDPAVEPAAKWLVAPNDQDKNLRPVPRHSRRSMLADALTGSRAFALNAANRFWAVVIGRGVIEPVDLRHSGNAPGVDDLLDLLADALTDHRFDISAYWRELAMTRAYQAAYDPPTRLSGAVVEATPQEESSQLAQAAESEARRRESAAREAWQPLQLAAQSLAAEQAAALKIVAEKRGAAEAAKTAWETARSKITQKSELRDVLEKATAQCAEAASIVKDAPELVQAATLLLDRLAAANTEIAALTQEIAHKEADHASQSAAFIDAETKATARGERLAAARSAAAAAWDAVEKAALLAREGRSAARRATRDASKARALADFATAAAHLDAARERRHQAAHESQLVEASVAGVQEASRRLPEDAELAAVLAQVKTRQATAMEATAASSQAVDQAAAAVAAATDTMVPRWTEGFALTTLTPLSPEQLCWSTLAVTGALDPIRTQAANEWDQKNPASAGSENSVDPGRVAARVAGIQALVEEKVRPYEDQFIQLFGNGAGSPQTDFFATSDQALYFENAGVVRSWTQPGGGNLAERLVSLNDPAERARELFLAVLNRHPSAEESAEIVSQFSRRPEEPLGAAVSNALWALLTSAEFRFKH